MTESPEEVPPASSPLRRHIGLGSATALVVANIIGAGVFTTTGFQAADLGHPGFILLLWFLGGALAFCGALCYGELGAAIPEAGGEYIYLRETFGPLFGFMSAFVSLIAGFSAPIAAACKGFTHYLGHFIPGLASDALLFGFVSGRDLVAVGVVWFLIAIHLRAVHRGIRFNDLVTVFKVAGIALIIIVAFAIGKGDIAHLAEESSSFEEMTRGTFLSAFATSLIFVMFCYSGWNASGYIASEMKNPQRHLPRSLFLGTSIVIILYLGLNLVYFYGASVEELAGRPDVGLVAFRNLFGPRGVSVVSIVLCVSILASASAMTIAGPRVYYALGRDIPSMRALSAVNPRTGAPNLSLLVQGLVTTTIVLTGRLDQIQQYAGFTLSLFTTLSVGCVLILRRKRPDMPRPFRVWGYPITPLVFLGSSLWMMIFAIRGRPTESTVGLATVVVGGLLFSLLRRRSA